MPPARRPAQRRRPERPGAGASSAARPKRRSRLRLYLGLALLAVIGLAVLLRSLLLAALAGPLVVEESPAASARAVLIIDGDRRFAEAAGLLLTGSVSEALVFEEPPNRLVLAGLVPGAGDLARRELRRNGIAEPVVGVLEVPEHATGDWVAARALGRWLDAHPDAEVIVLCRAFSSGLRAFVFSRVLGERAARISWAPLTDRRYSRSDWWKSEAGALGFVEGWSTLLQARLVGDVEVPVRMHDAAAWLASIPGGRPPVRELAPPPERAAPVPEANGAETASPRDSEP